MKSNFSNILIYTCLAALGVFLAFWLRSEFQDEKAAFETEMHLHFVEDLIGLEKTDIKNFLNREEGDMPRRRLTIYDSVEDRRVMFLKDSFSQGLKDSIRLIIQEGVPVWNTNSDKLTIKRIDIGAAYADSLPSKTTDSTKPKIKLKNLVKTSSVQFEQRERELNIKAFKAILPQAIFAFLLFSLLISGILLLQKNHREQQILADNKNTLIRNITHELQTPIAIIAVALEAIQNFNIKEDKVKTNEYIDTSRKQLKNLSGAIDRVMQMSKMDERKEVFQFEEISLQEIAEAAAEDLKLEAESKNADILIESIGELPLVRADKYHLKNVLFNLIDNGLKYGKSNGEVSIILEATSTDFLIKIKDNGTGIDLEHQEKIFERFYRITDGNRHDVKGYGLGLSYARQVVEAHGGTISLLNSSKKGSTFLIKIPCNP